MAKEFTKEHEKILEQYADEWIKIGMSTGHADEGEIRKAVHKVYECADLPQPKYVVITNSPIQNAICMTILEATEGKYW